MCTVTFVARRNGYALGMNRDEKLVRPIGLPPKIHQIGERHAVFPSEPSGGTWVGLNDLGISLALINWYSVTGHAAEPSCSRGGVVKSAIFSRSLDEVRQVLAQLPLAQLNPFRLIGIFPQSRSVTEWRWNLKELETQDHPWRTAIWISSGFDEPGAQRVRGQTFQNALGEASAGTNDWLRRLHRSHLPNRGPFSICMHRTDAATVSFTKIRVRGQGAVLEYLPGPPCAQKTIARVKLDLA